MIINILEKALIIATVVVVGYFVLNTLGDYSYQGQPQDLILEGTVLINQ